MSEATEKKEQRTFAAIQQEYVRLCTQAGDLQFKAESIKKDLEMLNAQMRDLGLEAIAVQKAEAEAAAKKAAEAPAPAAEASANG